jgi:hypothetical protein
MYSAPPLTQEPVWLFARRENVAPATVLLKKVKIRGRVLGGHWSHKSRHQFQRLSAQPPFRLRLKCLSLPAYRLSLKLPCLPPCRLSLRHPSQSHSPTAFTAIAGLAALIARTDADVCVNVMRLSRRQLQSRLQSGQDGASDRAPSPPGQYSLAAPARPSRRYAATARSISGASRTLTGVNSPQAMAPRSGWRQTGRSRRLLRGR